jgi:hypothetical protein
MMRKYSTIVSGSTVLHLFCPSEDWNPNDLDLFVSRDCLGDQGEIHWHIFLTSTCNYTYVGSDDDTVSYGIRKYSYEKHGKYIEMMIIDDDPIGFVIRSSYGTHMSNYATADKAYCLFPETTLENRKMVVFRNISGLARHSFDRYRNRGFSCIIIQDASLRHEELVQRRLTGDALCRIKPFSTIDNDKNIIRNDSEISFQLTPSGIRVYSTLIYRHDRLAVVQEDPVEILYDSDGTVEADTESFRT